MAAYSLFLGTLSTVPLLIMETTDINGKELQESACHLSGECENFEENVEEGNRCASTEEEQRANSQGSPDDHLTCSSDAGDCYENEARESQSSETNAGENDHMHADSSESWIENFRNKKEHEPSERETEDFESCSSGTDFDLSSMATVVVHSDAESEEPIFINAAQLPLRYDKGYTATKAVHSFADVLPPNKKGIFGRLFSRFSGNKSDHRDSGRKDHTPPVYGKGNHTGPAGRRERRRIKTNAGKPIQLVRVKKKPTGDESGSTATGAGVRAIQDAVEMIEFDKSALESLKAFGKNKKLAVIGVTGVARAGKTTLANNLVELLGGQGTITPDRCFRVGHKTDACTAGIWMWNVPLKLPMGPEEIDVLILDCEGTDRGHEGVTNVLTALTTVMSSVLVVNIDRHINNTALVALRRIQSIVHTVGFRSEAEYMSWFPRLYVAVRNVDEVRVEQDGIDATEVFSRIMNSTNDPVLEEVTAALNDVYPPDRRKAHYVNPPTAEESRKMLTDPVVIAQDPGVPPSSFSKSMVNCLTKLVVYARKYPKILPCSGDGNAAVRYCRGKDMYGLCAQLVTALRENNYETAHFGNDLSRLYCQEIYDEVRQWAMPMFENSPSLDADTVQKLTTSCIDRFVKKCQERGIASTVLLGNFRRRMKYEVDRSVDFLKLMRETTELNKETEALQARLEESRKLEEQQQEEMMRLKQTCDVLKDRERELEVQYADKQRELHVCTLEIEKLRREETAEARKKLLEMGEQMRRVLTELGNVHEELQTTQSEMSRQQESLQQKFDEAQKEVENYRSIKKDLDDTIGAQNEKIAELEAEVTKAKQPKKPTPPPTNNTVSGKTASTTSSQPSTKASTSSNNKPSSSAKDDSICTIL